MEVLAERRLAELRTARGEAGVHLLLHRADVVHEAGHGLVGLRELEDPPRDAARRGAAADEVVVRVGCTRGGGEAGQLGVDRVVHRGELLEDLARLGVPAVLVVDDRLEDVGLGEVLVAEVGRLEGEQVPEGLLVVADPVVGVRRLPQPFQPPLPAPRHLPVVEDGVAVLPVLVVDARELEERELAQLGIGPVRPLRVREPDDLLEGVRRGAVAPLRVGDEPLHELGAGEDVAGLGAGRVADLVHRAALRRRRGRLLLPDLRGEPAGLGPRPLRLAGPAGLGEGAPALELVLREEVVDPVLVGGRHALGGMLGDAREDGQLVREPAAEPELPLHRGVEEAGAGRSLVEDVVEPGERGPGEPEPREGLRPLVARLVVDRGELRLAQELVEGEGGGLGRLAIEELLRRGEPRARVGRRLLVERREREAGLRALAARLLRHDRRGRERDGLARLGGLRRALGRGGRSGGGRGSRGRLPRRAAPARARRAAPGPEPAPGPPASSEASSSRATSSSPCPRPSSSSSSSASSAPARRRRGRSRAARAPAARRGARRGRGWERSRASWLSHRVGRLRPGRNIDTPSSANSCDCRSLPIPPLGTFTE